MKSPLSLLPRIHEAGADQVHLKNGQVLDGIQVRLQQEIVSLRQLLARRRSHWPHPRRWPRIVRDPQGNVLRVVTDASGTVVQLADGNRCELTFDGASYSYIDQSGTVHLVQPVEQ